LIAPKAGLKRELMESRANLDLELAKRELLTGDNALVLVKAGRVLGTGQRAGIADLLHLAEQLGPKSRGAALADRVVGKAAALIAQHMGVTSVFTPLASDLARETLAKGGIQLECERLVPAILNRRGDGPCPMEKLVSAIDEPAAAVKALQGFLRDKQTAGVEDAKRQ
jgi:hypothetical protein